MVRISKSLKQQQDKEGKSGRYHREHRSTKGRQIHNHPIIKKKRMQFKSKLSSIKYDEEMQEARENLMIEEGFI